MKPIGNIGISPTSYKLIQDPSSHQGFILNNYQEMVEQLCMEDVRVLKEEKNPILGLVLLLW